MGTQADLARDLSISRAAVSQAFKKHNIQLGIDGKFDLDYAAWILKEKQDATKSKSQRSAKKQMPGLNNPRLRREVIRLLWPIWDEAIRTTIQSRAETSFEDEEDEIELVSIWYALEALWVRFHDICDRDMAPDMSDFPFNKPSCIVGDPSIDKPLEQVKSIIMQAKNHSHHHTTTGATDDD